MPSETAFAFAETKELIFLKEKKNAKYGKYLRQDQKPQLSRPKIPINISKKEKKSNRYVRCYLLRKEISSRSTNSLA